MALPEKLLRTPRAVRPALIAAATPSDRQSGLMPQIRMSNFGNLAVIIHDAQLKPGYPAIVRQLMTEVGYVVVPEAAVAERYTGKLLSSRGRLVRDSDPHRTWFWRFFDYM